MSMPKKASGSYDFYSHRIHERFRAMQVRQRSDRFHFRASGPEGLGSLCPAEKTGVICKNRLQATPTCVEQGTVAEGEGLEC